MDTGNPDKRMKFLRSNFVMDSMDLPGRTEKFHENGDNREHRKKLPDINNALKGRFVSENFQKPPKRNGGVLSSEHSQTVKEVRREVMRWQAVQKD